MYKFKTTNRAKAEILKQLGFSYEIENQHTYIFKYTQALGKALAAISEKFE